MSRRTARRALLLLAVAFLLCVAPLPAAALYHSSSEVLHWFSRHAAKHSSIMRFQELKDRRHHHVYLPVATITADAAAQPQPPKPAVLFVFGEHAREVITPEVALWTSRLLTDNTSSIYTWPELPAALRRAEQPGNASSSSGSDSEWVQRAQGWVQQVLQRLEVVVIPIEALDSRRLVEQGELCVRKTSTNVDLNRNWPFAWQQAADTDEQYGGRGPFSEPQSRLVKQLIDSHDGRLLGYVNVHSGEWALYTPWDSKPAYAPNLPADLPQLVDRVGRLCQCMAGPAGAVSGYLAFGTSMDYVYVHKKVPYPFTVEVFGGGDIGKLAAGQKNKLLTEYQLLSMDNKQLPKQAAATTTADSAGSSTPRRARTLHQHGQQQQQQQQHASLLQQLWSVVARRLQQQQLGPQQQQEEVQPAHLVPAPIPAEQQHRWPGRRRARRRRRQQQQQAATSDSAGDLSSQRQQVLLQLTQDQLQQQQQQPGQSATVAAASSVAAAGADDLFLQLANAANANGKYCFNAFNPADEGSYRRVVADWAAAFLVMLKHMAESDAAKNMTASLRQQDKASLAG